MRLPMRCYRTVWCRLRRTLMEYGKLYRFNGTKEEQRTFLRVVKWMKEMEAAEAVTVKLTASEKGTLSRPRIRRGS